MFGLYRWALASMVVLQHLFNTLPFNVGNAAVVNFFMLSGYVMTFLLRRNYPRYGRSLLLFYVDRFLRILPQYLFFLLLSETWFHCFGYQFFGHFMTGPDSPWIFFLNALIVPLNYGMYYYPILVHTLIPAAWSLGLEEQFYWLFPFLVFEKWLGRLIVVGSVVIFWLAMTQHLNDELYGYRLLPGVLFIFMMGKCLADYRQTKSREAFWTGLILWYVCISLLVLIYLIDLKSPHDRDVLWGLVAGYPLLFFLSGLPRRQWDELIGHSSYGIFLSHVLVINILVHFEWLSAGPVARSIESVVGATVAGFFGYYIVERAIMPIRYRLRKRLDGGYGSVR